VNAVRLFDVDDKTDAELLAARIDASCQSAGLKRFELVAMDAKHRSIGSCAIGERRGRRARQRSNPPEHGSGAAGEARRITAVLIGALQAEGASLRQENMDLRKLLALLTNRPWRVPKYKDATTSRSHCK
jgi:hypothetical protein